MRVAKMGFGVAATLSLSLLIPATVALGASPPAGGNVNVFVTPLSANGPKANIVVTGAIGDYGTALSATKSDKTAANGAYEKITLQQGSFLVNATKLNA